MAGLMIQLMEQIGAPFRGHPPDTKQPEEIDWLFRTSLGHLIDESKFDFLAIHSRYAKRCFNEKRFAASSSSTERTRKS
jgi:hypothetical protein